MTVTSGLLQTVGQSALGAAVGVIVGQSVGLLYKRFLKRESEHIEQLVRAIEDMIGVTINIPKVQKGNLVNFAPYRKALAAGIAATASLIFTGLLTWATTAHVSALAQLIAPVVPASVRPILSLLVGGIVGGAAIVKAVYQTENRAAHPEPAVTITPNPAATTKVATSTAPTSVVNLLPAPTAASYL